MTIQHRGSVFEFDDVSPGTTASGSKTTAAHCWKFCPYSTQSTDSRGDTRVPEGQKTYHPETNGQLHSYGLGGGLGWTCADNACSFFLGTTTTGVEQTGRRFIALPEGSCPNSAESLATLSGEVDHRIRNHTIVPGTRYIEL